MYNNNPKVGQCLKDKREGTSSRSLRKKSRARFENIKIKEKKGEKLENQTKMTRGQLASLLTVIIHGVAIPI